MGKSLNIHSDGVHMAFGAGTGVLPFMDLVAQVAFYNLGIEQLMGAKQERLTDHFKLRFYVSFQSRKDSIGLELLEALHEFCNQTGRDNFELHLRISNENKPRRWDAAFINEQLAGESEKSLKKVWVCGPPVMAETFDLAFSGMKAQNPNRFGTGVLEVL